MAKFDEPREVEIQWTYERARAENDEDEDSLDEEAVSDVDFKIGESRETREISSWDEIPDGYEPVSSIDAEEYDRYLQNKDLIPEDEDEDQETDEDEDGDNDGEVVEDESP